MMGGELLAALVRGLSHAMLWFMIASGFSLIFGLEEIVNFAHGSLFMLGTFTAYEVSNLAGLGHWWFPLALLGGAVVAAGIGAAMEVGLLRRKFGREMDIILVTLGVMYIIHYVAVDYWGAVGGGPTMPAYLSGAIGPIKAVTGIILFKYRVFLIFLGFAIAILIKYLLDNTNLGLIVRAGIDDADMTSAMGANIYRVFTIVFAIGCALAGLGGAAVLGIEGPDTGVGLDYLFFAFALVVIGGRGSFEGTFWASVLAGIIYSVINWLPVLPSQVATGAASASIFVLMAIVLFTLGEEGIGGWIGRIRS